MTHKYRVSILVKDLHHIPEPVVHICICDPVPLEPDQARPIVQVQDLVVPRLFRQQGGPVPFVVGPSGPHRLVQPQPVRIVPERQRRPVFRRPRQLAAIRPCERQAVFRMSQDINPGSFIYFMPTTILYIIITTIPIGNPIRWRPNIKFNITYRFPLFLRALNMAISPKAIGINPTIIKTGTINPFQACTP